MTCIERHIQIIWCLFTTCTVVGTCESAGISLWCGYQQHYWIFQPCSAAALPSIEAWHHNICTCANTSGGCFPWAGDQIHPSYNQANSSLPKAKIWAARFSSREASHNTEYMLDEHWKSKSNTKEPCDTARICRSLFLSQFFQWIGTNVDSWHSRWVLHMPKLSVCPYPMQTHICCILSLSPMELG